jgi:hypothetical protein
MNKKSLTMVEQIAIGAIGGIVSTVIVMMITNYYLSRKKSLKNHT